LTPVGGHWDFIDNGFQPSITPLTVASEFSSNNSLTAKTIVLLLILQVFGIIVTQHTSEDIEILSIESDEFRTQSFAEVDLNFGYELSEK